MDEPLLLDPSLVFILNVAVSRSFLGGLFFFLAAGKVGKGLSQLVNSGEAGCSNSLCLSAAPATC